MTLTPHHSTSADDVPTLRLDSPSALVASVPYLVGFMPHESLVLVWMRDGRILATQRADLPPDGSESPRRTVEGWLDVIWPVTMDDLADAVFGVVVSERDHSHLSDVAAAVAARAQRAGIQVLDVVTSWSGRWRGLLCSDPGCCPDEGRLLDPETAALVAAEFVARGDAPLGSREDVVASWARDPVRAFALARAIEALDPRPASDAWRDEAIDEITAAIQRGMRPTAAEAARIVTDLLDVRVRDTVLWDVVAREEPRCASAVAFFGDLLRAAPPGWVAPVATCAALVAWIGGDGARARVALGRAEEDGIDYGLAALLGSAVDGALPPAIWVSALRALPRSQCRHGAARRG